MTETDNILIGGCAILTIDAMKRQLRIDPNDVDTTRDELIMGDAAAAEDLVLNYCHTSIEQLYADYGKVPAAVYKAMLMVATGIYDNPSSANSRQTYAAPFGVLAMLSPYVNLTDRSAYADERID